MKIAPDTRLSSSDYSGLSAVELLVVLADLQQQLALKDEALQSKDETIQSKDDVIRLREAHILLLEEMLRLRRAQRFAASSERLSGQLSLFDEAEMEVEIDSLQAQLPEDLPQTSKPKSKRRQRGFSASLLRERIVHIPADHEHRFRFN
ncbi:transposase, partial [Aeromonas jandaei]